MMSLVFLLSLATAEGPTAAGPAVDPSSLPSGWFLRDASDFVKLGSTPQRLVYQPTAGVTPLASVQIVARPAAKPLSDNVEDWTAEIVRAQGPYEFLAGPKLSRRGGRRVYRAELRADSNTNVQHYLALEAIEVNGNLLILFADQTRDRYQAGLNAVRTLFGTVRAK